MKLKKNHLEVDKSKFKIKLLITTFHLNRLILNLFRVREMLPLDVTLPEHIFSDDDSLDVCTGMVWLLQALALDALSGEPSL